MAEQANPVWRPMRKDDNAAVTAISDRVHGDYTEGSEVFASRLALYPAGCFVLQVPLGAASSPSAPLGYLIAHPSHRGAPPALNEVLDVLPTPAGTLYLHDIAVLSQARGSGAGAAALALVEQLARAEGLADVTLIAVNGADSYWLRQGFTIVAGGGYGPGTFLMRRIID